MKKICVVTGTRADYGILSGLMRLIDRDPEMELQTVVTNMHLSPEFGLTVKEIEDDGFRIDRKVEMLLSSDTPVGTVKSLGLAAIGFADVFDSLSPDLTVILGDRYEMLAVAAASVIFGIPVAHLHGGEITEGAYDENLRHAITKLSSYHFTATEEYRRRVIQMGESPDRVFNTGSIAVDAIRGFSPMSREELAHSLGITLDEDFIVVTFHPATAHYGCGENQVRILLEALEKKFSEKNGSGKVRIIFTFPNSDAEGRVMADIIREWCANARNGAVAVSSLGRKRYYSALAHCAAVVGNSSSGLIEAPAFGIPTLNIGDRQQGRTRGNTVTDCGVSEQEISDSLRHVLSGETRDFCAREGTNPYDGGGALETIHGILSRMEPGSGLPKKFFDITVDM